MVRLIGENLYSKQSSWKEVEMLSSTTNRDVFSLPSDASTHNRTRLKLERHMKDVVGKSSQFRAIAMSLVMLPGFTKTSIRTTMASKTRMPFDAEGLEGYSVDRSRVPTCMVSVILLSIIPQERNRKRHVRTTNDCGNKIDPITPLVRNSNIALHHTKAEEKPTQDITVLMPLAQDQ
jgi:hypothetical protein